MSKRLTVVISQGQSASPAKRQLEEDLVAGLLMERGVEVTVVPNLYDLTPDGTGMLCLQSIPGDMVVLSWLFPRAAHWILDRNQVRGRFGATLLKGSESEDAEDADDDDDVQEQAEDTAAEETSRADAVRPPPNRTIYCLDLRASPNAAAYVEEIRRISAEASVQTVNLLGFLGGSPTPAQEARYLAPAAGNVHSTPLTANVAAESAPAPLRIDEQTPRRWYPVIDFSRCTNCMECLDFCLFGVYGVDRAETILVEQPDNCRKGCPACSRVCPENAIIFPQHKTPAIAGSPDGEAGSFKIDLSKLFGAPDAMEVAAQERDVELVAVGRDAVGLSVGIPKRQEGRADSPPDDLDRLMDELDGF